MLPILIKVKIWLARAGKAARSERALPLPQAEYGEHILTRAELGGTESRMGTCGLHGLYPGATEQDRRARARRQGFSERLRLDARCLQRLPGSRTDPYGPVVASWISMRYYGSTVAPDTFVSVNKLSHNVVGGIGVLEGNHRAPSFQPRRRWNAKRHSDRALQWQKSQGASHVPDFAGLVIT